MSYYIKQKFDIKEILNSPAMQKKVFLHEPDYFARRLYEKTLNEAGYSVDSSESLAELLHKIAVFNPHLLILSFSGEELKLFLNILSQIRNYYQHLPVLTVGNGLAQEILAEIMNIGVASHIERSLSRPADLVLIVKNII
jgi:DNA-binding NtrC family response regulator